MTTEDLIRVLYDLEKPFLQRNDWGGLRVRVSDLVQQCLSRFPGVTAADVEQALRSVRLDGRIMLLPDWSEAKQNLPPGSLSDSRAHWELADLDNLEEQVPPSWVRRKVFLPDALKSWFVRSRVAELTRQLAWNRERFGLAPSSAHVGYELQARYRPLRRPNGIDEAVAHMIAMAQQGRFSQATDVARLSTAIDVVGKGLARANGSNTLAAFQTRGWESVLDSLWNPTASHHATIVAGGVSSGKTYAFTLPILTVLVYRSLLGQGGRNRALIVYPRTSLVEDQYHGLKELIAGINDELSSRGLAEITTTPALDAGQFLGESIGADGALADVLPEVTTRRIEVVVTTPESLKNRMIDCRALATYLTNVEIVVFDEIHLMEGLAGCQGIYLVRRLRQLMRTLRNDPAFEPAWVGASATVAEPIEHCARALSLSPDQVAHVEPASDELERFGTFHHVFVHTRVGKSAISAVTNGLACVTHCRNDGTAHSHSTDPGATPPQNRAGADIPKTIAFVDSLSTIGRLRFTTADNERTYDAFDAAPPYYTWFYRPAARLRATNQEANDIERLAGSGARTRVREWCSACHRGEPAVIDGTPLQAPAFRFLRIRATQMNDKAQRKNTPPGLPERLAQLPAMVGNLDE